MSLVNHFGIIRHYENWWLDLSLRLKNHPLPQEFTVVVIGIDDVTMAEWGYSEPVVVPVTPRREMGDLLETITIDADTALRPAVVGVDLFFNIDSDGTKSLQTAVDEIARSPGVPPLVLGRLAVKWEQHAYDVQKKYLEELVEDIEKRLDEPCK
ncbi:MAG: CHASE2 domain-containing protein [Deltaproteobacteria bacterium]|nr:CHASE2 domain-containing protein [Candidatus Zymogenaceae bacterium]